MLEYHPRYHYINDFTIIEKDGEYHLFHITGERLKMSLFLTDLPKQGHAVSRDLMHWQEQPFVTSFGGPCSAVKHNGRFALLGNLNCIYWSDDLTTWSEPEPVQFDFNRPDSPYETEMILETASYNSHRDPNIHWDPERNIYVMFFCSRVKASLEPDIFRRGCIGLAESEDLIHWHLGPPALPPGNHLFPESPHVIDLNGKYHLFFCLSPETGLRHAVADSLRGPYQEVEGRDLLPTYLGASETVKTGDGWIFLGRLKDRNERCNQSRLAPRALCLPLTVHANADQSIAFHALPALEKLRDDCLFDSRQQMLFEHWRVIAGDWRINTTGALAANRHELIPPNSLYGSCNVNPAQVRYNTPIADFDLEFDMQLPTFNGNDTQFSAGFAADGVKFQLCSELKSFICQDVQGDVLAQAPLPDFKADRYYHIRLFRCDSITQLYLDGNLIMYLPAYGDASGMIEFFVKHADLIVSNIRLWTLDVQISNGFSFDTTQGGIMNGVVF
ncbi:MAG: hypothetical protein WCV67_16065 [Victivallaceae bacterium]|jgi:hypothetical protein